MIKHRPINLLGALRQDRKGYFYVLGSLNEEGEFNVLERSVYRYPTEKQAENVMTDVLVGNLMAANGLRANDAI